MNRREKEVIDRMAAEIDRFDPAFLDFMAARAYRDAEDILLSVAYQAFLAGWEAAGGPSIYRTEIEKYEFLQQLLHHSDP